MEMSQSAPLNEKKVNPIENITSTFAKLRAGILTNVLSRVQVELERAGGAELVGVWSQRISRLSNFLPMVGNVKVLTEASLGKGAGGESLGTVDRMWYVASGVIGVVSWLLATYAANEGDAHAASVALHLNIVSATAMAPTSDDVERALHIARDKGLFLLASLMEGLLTLTKEAPEKYDALIHSMRTTV